jgi:alpha-L-rhamnosidase
MQVVEMAEKSAVLFTAIGMGEYAAYARDLGKRMKDAVREHLIDADNAIAIGACQTSQAIALRFGLFLEQERPRAYRALLDMIKAKDGHVDCGMIGLRHIFHVLFEGGDAELALSMITRADAPSYGSMIGLGATALFESLIPNGLNESENHHFYGDIIHLFIAKLVGIRINPTLTDTKSALISPTFASGIDYAAADYTFTEGRLSVRWQRTDGQRAEIFITVPGSVSATFKHKENRLTLTEGENRIEIEL